MAEEDVADLARRILGSDPVEVDSGHGGLLNRSWRVVDSDGAVYVLKIGPLASAAKWRASHRALDLAVEAGVPAPRLVHDGEHDGHLVRLFTWIDGTSAADTTIAGADEDRFIASVGAAVASLHRVAFDGFSSRVDGSAPQFRRWSAYLDLRLGQIRERWTAAGLDPVLFDCGSARAADLAGVVDDVAEPVLCHRDLHAGNLIVRGDGALSGIIDWDGAELWDRAGDWFKLEHELLRAYPDRGDDLLAAYLDGAPVPPRWAERRRLVHLVECLNTLPNVVTQGWDDAYADRARHRLDQLLTD